MKVKNYPYQTCPYCGAHLDYGEKCDCSGWQAFKEKTYFALSLSAIAISIYHAAAFEADLISFSCALFIILLSGGVSFFCSYRLNQLTEEGYID